MLLTKIKKEEFTYAFELFELRLRNSIVEIVIAFSLLAGILLVSGFHWFGTPAKGGGYVFDYSSLLLVLLIPAAFTLLMKHESMQKKEDLCLHTNANHFLANFILLHFISFLLASFVFALYLAQALLFTVLSSSRPELILAYDFSFTFLMTAFLVVFICLSVLASALLLFAAIVRVLRLQLLYVVIPLVAAVASFVFPGFVAAALQSLFSALFVSGSLIAFLLLSALIWILFFVAALTLAGRAGVNLPKSLSPILQYGAMIAWIIPTFFMSVGALAGLPLVHGNIFPTEPFEVRIDASQVPAGSHIQIRQPTITQSTPDGETTIPLIDVNFSPVGSAVSDEGFWILSDRMPSQPFNGTEIILSYAPPSYVVQNPLLIQEGNPRIEASLEGTTLLVDYDFEPREGIVYLPVWRIMSSLNLFSDQNNFRGSGADPNQWPSFMNAYVEVSSR